MSKFTKIAIWTGIVLLLLNLIGTVIIPLYQNKKMDKVYELKIQKQAEILQRKRLEAENEALIKSHFMLQKKLEKYKTKYDETDNINFADSSFSYIYNEVTDYINRHR